MRTPIEIGRVRVPPEAISFTTARSSGPGGQNVNKVASKIDLRVDLGLIVGLDDAARARLLALAKNRLDADGRLFVTSQKTRDQLTNLEDAIDKVRALVQAALTAPRPRRPTKPSRGAVRRRLEDKRKAGDKKRTRSRGRGEE